MGGKHKHYRCEIRSKVMRSDHLKKHMKKHVDPSLEEPICKDIKSIKDETSMYSEKPKVNDLHSDGLNILEDDINDILETSMNKPKDPHSDGLDDTPGDEIDEKELKKILVLYNYKYTKKRN